MLGGGQLLIFRAMDCTKLVNAIPICHAQPIAVQVGTEGDWTVKTCARQHSAMCRPLTGRPLSLQLHPCPRAHCPPPHTRGATEPRGGVLSSGPGAPS